MKNHELLTKPFSPDQIRERPGQHGKVLRYVDVTSIIERLNETFAFEWSFDIVEHQIRDGEVIVLGKLTAGGVTKAAFGGSGITVDRVGNVVSLADDLKAASSDALKKSASMLGVALEIYGGHREASPAPERASRDDAPARPLLPQERVTARQLGALHAAGRDHGFARGDLEALVADRTGRRELGQLSRLEASSLIDELRSNHNGANGRA
ncbi:MAG TPA: Rad52/Rad22 family DNA repair protein [Polyangiaceae bacterium]|jgi:hypothetical protein|nr:Rad52/Rad22 family DNA repair protein [Polyangiaceae bacterium]